MGAQAAAMHHGGCMMCLTLVSRNIIVERASLLGASSAATSG